MLQPPGAALLEAAAVDVAEPPAAVAATDTAEAIWQQKHQPRLRQKLLMPVLPCWRLSADGSGVLDAGWSSGRTC